MHRILLALLLLGAAMPATANHLSKELANAMAGTFVLKDEEQYLTDRRQPFVASAIGETLVHQQINEGDDQVVYRQRVFVFRNIDDHVQMVAWSFKEPGAWENASPAMLGELTWDDLERSLPDGCEQIWEKTDDGYYGLLKPENCRIISSRTGKPRLIGAESQLTSDALKQTERGYDENGEQLFGTEPGEYLILKRVDD